MRKRIGLHVSRSFNTADTSKIYKQMIIRKTRRYIHYYSIYLVTRTTFQLSLLIILMSFYPLRSCKGSWNPGANSTIYRDN